MKHSSRTATLCAAGAASLAALAALWGCGAGGGPEGVTARVERGRFELRVSETCEFKPLHSWVMLARASDKIDWVVPEGTRVKPGDMVFTQDRTRQEDWLSRDSNEMEAAGRNLKEVRRQVEMEREEIRLELAAKASAVDLAQTRLAEVTADPTREQLAEAEAAVRAALTAAEGERAAASSAERLAGKGFLSGAEAAAEKLAAEVAGINLERSRLRLSRLKAGASKQRREIARREVERARASQEMARADAARREADLKGRITDAQAQVASLERSVARARRHIDARQVRATGAGVVIYRNLHHRRKSKPEVGSRIWHGAGVVDVADLSRMKVRTQLAERYIRHLHPGAGIKVRPDPLPGATLEAEVTWIDLWSRDRSADLAKADRKKEGLSGVKVFALEAAVEGSDPRIKPGFKGKAEFLLVDLPGALIVPAAALFGSPHQRFVLVSEGGRVRRVPVEVLADDGLKAAVEGQLEEGQELVTRDRL